MVTPYLGHHVTTLLATTQRLLTPLAVWVKGKPERQQTHCLITGLTEATIREGYRQDVFNRAEHLLHEALLRRVDAYERVNLANLPKRLALIEFNDHPDTTHADVLALLDDAMRAA